MATKDCVFFCIATSVYIKVDAGLMPHNGCVLVFSGGVVCYPVREMDTHHRDEVFPNGVTLYGMDLICRI